uniref:DDE Tnp4 domain-containing protein n=1 Tax=Salmo trutta TaxID=8032 RepID=A0A674A1E1_SALTR
MLWSSGTTCAVHGCTYKQTQLNDWLKLECFDHKPKSKSECSCQRWYSFHRTPNDDEQTRDNPYPKLFLGYERPPEKRCRFCRRVDRHVTRTGMLTSFDIVLFQRTAMEDHTYSKGPIITCGMTTSPAPERSLSVADVTLKDDADCLLYTGIPLLEFNTLVSRLQGFAPTSSTMPVVDQILLTLMKLRQNFVIADLARRFKRSPGQVSKTLTFWIDVIAEHTKDLIPLLPRETIKATMPQVFQENFSNTTCVTDCTEGVDSITESYSHYYANNTVKYLVAPAPSGIVMFISEAYCGKCSDRFITQNSGFLDHLRAGDEVMGDRGFTIRDLLEERNVRLVLTAFPHKQCQLTNEQVYKILSQTVLISLVPKIDNIRKICAALVNLRGKFFDINDELF